MAIATLPGKVIRDVTDDEVVAINIYGTKEGLAVNVQVQVLNEDGTLNHEFTAEKIDLDSGTAVALLALVKNKIVPAVNVKIEQKLGVTFV